VIANIGTNCAEFAGIAAGFELFGFLQDPARAKETSSIERRAEGISWAGAGGVSSSFESRMGFGVAGFRSRTQRQERALGDSKDRALTADGIVRTQSRGTTTPAQLRQ
jgi:hypothetical protein